MDEITVVQTISREINSDQTKTDGNGTMQVEKSSSEANEESSLMLSQPGEH